MKMIDFKNKKTTWWLIGVLVLILLLIVLYKGLEGKSFNKSNNGESVVDIANSDDYTKFEGKVSASFEGSHNLSFMFLHSKALEVTQGVGNQSKWFKLTNASSTNDVTLYFTYEGGRGFTPDDYINEVLKVNGPVVVEDVKFANNASSSVKHVTNESGNVEYYIQGAKGADGDSWLVIVENNNPTNQVSKDIAKDLMRSFEIK